MWVDNGDWLMLICVPSWYGVLFNLMLHRNREGSEVVGMRLSVVGVLMQ
jgi:hypothetical protein